MINWSFYITAFAMGLISSFHCVVMCGPLSFALPVNKFTPGGKAIAFISYNSGRIFTYSLLGMLIGVTGYRAGIFGWQRGLSIFTGVIMLLMLVQKYIAWPGGRSKFSPKQPSFTYKLVLRCMTIKGIPGFFAFGMANGLLPCGMVYFALVTALNTDSVLQSVLFMFIFGTGTFPAMFALNISARLPGSATRLSVKKVVPLFITVVAILLIFRGLNLGIPYLSPYQQVGSGEGISCEP